MKVSSLRLQQHVTSVVKLETDVISQFSTTAISTSEVAVSKSGRKPGFLSLRENVWVNRAKQDTAFTGTPEQASKVLFENFGSFIYIPRVVANGGRQSARGGRFDRKMNTFEKKKVIFCDRQILNY
jgi:hypothetical protein